MHKNMGNIKAIIFDCFGVIYVDATKAYFSRFPEKYEELHNLDQLSDHGLIDRRSYTQAVSELTSEPIEKVEEEFQKEHVLNKPLIDLIHRMKPHYKIGLLSNIGRDWLQDFFNEYQLRDLFNAVVLSSEEGIAKPNPIIFERAADRLGVNPSQCLFIDDLPENCAGAEAVGMKTILFKDNHSVEGLLQ
ncbi:MAG TPA: HAD family phosphatase [Candidatus Saccharimonadales bacterium]